MCGRECLRFVATPNVIVEELPWGPHDWLVRPDLTESRFLQMVRVTMSPGEAHQFHRHPHFEEAIYYLEGRAEQWVGTEKRIMSAGELAHVPTNEVHGTYNLFDEPCVFLVALASAEFQDPMTVDVFREEPWCGFHAPREY